LKLAVVVAVSGRSDCNKSMRGIKAVAVQRNTSPQQWASTLAMARMEEVERLPAAQVP
jgi:hypothetical protein